MSEEKKPQLHYSALDTYSKCGEQYRRRYIEGEKIPPGIALIVGTAVDKSVSKDLVSKRDTKVLLTLDEVKSEAFDAFGKSWDQGIRVTKEDLDGRDLGAFKGENIDKAIRLSELHHRELAPSIEPLHVQREWAIDIGEDFDIVGTIDVQTEEKTNVVTFKGPQLRVGIIDTKTAGKSPPADQAEKSLQLTAYSFAVKVLDNRMPDYVGLNFLVDNKTPVVKQLRSVRTELDFEPFLARVHAATEGTRKGVFIPARPDDWWCNQRWCGYFDTCGYVRRPVSEVVQIELGA